MKTIENLKAAFSGESQANRKYLAFAKQAEKEGKTQIAKLFRAVAEAETVHAHAHLRAMDGIGDTLANLKEAIEGEEYEFSTMYKDFLVDAKEEGHKKAIKSMTHAMEVEKIHHGLYNDALKAIESGEDLPEATIHVCEYCGHTVLGGVPEKCPVCGATAKAFGEVA